VNSASWSLRLSASAEQDYRKILQWSAERFGARQARVYATTLRLAFTALTSGPAVAGVRERPEFGRNLCSLHITRQGRKGRHFIIFRVSRAPKRNLIEVLRILHDSMDLERQLKNGEI
jgi:toxin ParE1/3/4